MITIINIMKCQTVDSRVPEPLQRIPMLRHYSFIAVAKVDAKTTMWIAMRSELPIGTECFFSLIEDWFGDQGSTDLGVNTVTVARW